MVIVVMTAWTTNACRFDPEATVHSPDTSVLCGNGTLDPGEDCDGTDLDTQTCESLGFAGGQLSCNASCHFDTSSCLGGDTCGNGIIEGNEECDGGQLGGETCLSQGFSGGTLQCSADCRLDTSQCQIPNGCGNGILDEGEECDDDNNENGDGCSAACIVEDGWDCNGEPSQCTAFCGDGIVIAGQEECDDNNNDNGDGCSATCTVEPFFSCDNEPSRCTCRILVDGANGSNTGDGSTWDQAFQDLRDGMEQAVNLSNNLGENCEVWVAQGTYEASDDNEDASFALQSNLHIYGGFCGSETLRSERDLRQCTTTLAANRAHRVLSAIGITGAILDGFTITGGAESDCGGGLYVEDAGLEVNHCTFDSNSAAQGGALCLTGTSTVTIFADHFTNNTATDGDGGAILLAGSGSLEIRASMFEGNQAHKDDDGDGGALASYTPTTLVIWNSQFNDNEADDMGGAISATGATAELHGVHFTGNSSGTGGGALRSGYGIAVTAEGCTFTQNQSTLGGAWLVVGGTATIKTSRFEDNIATHAAGAIGGYGDNEARATLTVSMCSFSGNHATEYGGAVRISAWESLHPADAAFDNCLFWNNEVTDRPDGGAITVYYGATTTIDDCTITQNSANNNAPVGGVQVFNATLTVKNSIIWDNEGSDLSQNSSTVTVTYSDVPRSPVLPAQAWPGEGNIAADPLFVDPRSNDFHLGNGSPCIDAAENLAYPLDLEGNPRRVDVPAVQNTGKNNGYEDMGAYEAQ